MVIYIDVIIIENLIMNCIILYATSIISKSEVSKYRVILASLIGATFSILEYILNFKYYGNMFVKIFFAIIIVFVAFRPESIKKLIKLVIMFYLTTFTFGGVANYLIMTINPKKLILNNGNYSGIYIIKIIFLGAAVGSILLIISFKLAKNKISKKDMICKIRITLNKKQKIINAIIDTGNMLKEPITGNSVIVVEKSELQNIMPEEILNNIEHILGGDFSKISDRLIQEYISKLKVIPFSSLGNPNGMLLGIKPEKVEIIDDEISEKNNVILGIYNKKLSKRGEYKALIGID